MRTAALLFLFAIPCGFSLAQGEKLNQPPDGFEAAFNGRDLDGWHARPGNTNPEAWRKLSDEEREKQRAEHMAVAREHWTVDDGDLVNDGNGPYLTTDREYGDIELLLEYKTVAKADSGIYLRGTPQVQIWDYTEAGGKWDRGADKGSGGLYNNQVHPKLPLVLADKPFGEWNSFRIVQVGSRTSVWLNGKLVVDHAIMENYWDRQRPFYPAGPIELQTHGGEIRWRNVFVREIPPAEANEILAAHNGDGFTPIFNGKTLEGWTGATENYEVKDGAIVCQPGKGGVLFTEEEYGDFTARLEILVPPGANNGLAIRYPGDGDPAYSGMCELQVLDTEHSKYSGLDPRQAHGSAYGMVPAARGYLREAGEWNFQQVTVKGSRVTVELNGTIILDADLSEVKEFMAGRPHPGKDREAGHFGFAGHNDPVQFRNVEIKRLDR